MTTPIVNFSPFAGAGAQFFDSNGVPLAGGLLYTYQAGSTTQQATYTTSSATVQNANPIVLGSDGRTPQEIWLLNGYSYKFVLQNSGGSTIGTYDNIPYNSSNAAIINDASSVAFEQGASTTAGSFLIGGTYLITYIGTTNFTAIGASNNTVGTYFTATGVGSGTGTAQISRTVQSKLQDMVSVFDFMTTAQITAVQSGNSGNIDCTTPFQNAVNYATTYNRTIFVPTGTYKLTSQITKASSSNGLNIVGENAIGTILNYSTLSANTSLFVIVGVEANANAVISDLTFTGNTTSTAIEIQQQNFQLVQRCIFNTNEIGITLTNTTGYTEYCVATDCIFQGCYQALFYNNTTTTFTSFHGSGLNHCQISEVSGSTLSPIQIGGSTVANNNFVVYNAVLDFQCWKYNTSTPIIQNNSTSNIINFHGTFTIENFTGSNITLGGGSKIWYAGHYTSNSNYAYPGTLFFVYDIYSNSSGTPYATLKPFKIPNKVLAAGANNIYDFGYVPGVGSPQSFLTTITFTSSADAWELSYLLIIYTGTGGSNSSVTTLAQLANYFGGNHAAPTFSMSGDVLVATGTGWPAATISCVGVVQSHANLGDLLL